MSAGVYCLLDPVSTEVRYVGQTIDFNARRASHRRRPKTRTPVGCRLRKLHDQGLRAVFVPLLICGSVAQRDAMEIAFIQFFRLNGCRLLNLEDGGRGVTESDRKARSERLVVLWRNPSHRAKVVPILQEAARRRIGVKVSEEIKARMRGKVAWNKGKTPSQSTRERISRRLTGRALSPTHREAISTGLRGHIHSDEIRAKISAAHTGMSLTEETRSKISLALTGRSVSDETRAKLRIAQQARRAREKGAS